MSGDDDDNDWDAEMEEIAPSDAKRWDALREKQTAAAAQQPATPTPTQTPTPPTRVVVAVQDTGLEVASPIRETQADGTVIVGETHMLFLETPTPQMHAVSTRERLQLKKLHEWFLVETNMARVPSRGNVKPVLAEIKACAELRLDLAEAMWLAHLKKDPRAWDALCVAKAVLVYRGNLRQQTWVRHRRYTCELTFPGNVLIIQTMKDEMFNFIYTIGGRTAASFVPLG